MPTIASLSEIDNLWLLFVAASLAGLTRGFSGFGTAMVYLPLATTVLSPIWAIMSMMIFDLFGPLPLVKRAWKSCDKKDVALLLCGLCLTLPIGMSLLLHVDPRWTRLVICSVSLLVLAVIISGWHYQKTLSQSQLLGLGGASGLLGGFAGLPGPLVIVIYVSGSQSAATIRANIMLFLLGFDVAFFALYLGMGQLDPTPLWIGLLLTLPYTLMGLVGQALFDPKAERVFRLIAYGLISLSALMGLYDALS